MPLGALFGLGMGVLSGLAGSKVEEYDDKRKLEYEENLQGIRLKGQKEMTDYNYQKQKQMWEETNYAAQKEQLEKAGLNPGLMYGMGGGGGTTIGSGGGSGMSSGGASQAKPIDTAMGMQLATQQAQIDLIKAQTENVKAQTTKTSGVDTDESVARQQSILQGINESQSKVRLNEMESGLKGLQMVYEGRSMEDRLDAVKFNATNLMYQMNMAANENGISNETWKTKIQLIKTEAIGAGLRNVLTVAQTNNTKMDTSLKAEQINKVKSDIEVNWRIISNFVQENQRKWESLSVEQRNAETNKILADFKVTDEKAQEMLRGLINIIMMKN